MCRVLFYSTGHLLVELGLGRLERGHHARDLLGREKLEPQVAPFERPAREARREPPLRGGVLELVADERDARARVAVHGCAQVAQDEPHPVIMEWQSNTR